MIYCYPIIQGEKKRHWFYEKWDEVPIDVFIEWTKLARKCEPIEDRLSNLYDKILKGAEERTILKYEQKHDSVAKLDRKLARFHSQAKPIQDQYDVIVCEMVAIFTSVPIEELAKFSRSKDSEIGDNHFDAYKNRMEALSSSSLPVDSISEFAFQTKTDQEIKELEDKYAKLGFIKRIRKNGVNLKAEIKAAKHGTYKINDIWKQTTLANKHFQERANEIIGQLEKGNYEGLTFLVALVTTEAQQEQGALDAIKAEKNTAYLEKYREKFLEVFKYRLKVFTEQRNQLKIGTLKRIANFFLHSFKM